MRYQVDEGGASAPLFLWTAGCHPGRSGVRWDLRPSSRLTAFARPRSWPCWRRPVQRMRLDAREDGHFALQQCGAAPGGSRRHGAPRPATRKAPYYNGRRTGSGCVRRGVVLRPRPSSRPPPPPLQRVRVVDVSKVATAPMAARYLADFGAGVMHAENTRTRTGEHGVVSRGILPPRRAQISPCPLDAFDNQKERY